MNVLLGVSGGISAYKACSIASGLKSCSHDVRVVMTKNAQQFITEMSLSVISGNPVIVDMWEELDGEVTHIKVAQEWADMFVIAPATANIIGKIANGIADDMLSTIALGIPSMTPKRLYPAMNSVMLKNPAVQQNLHTLSLFGYDIGETAKGRLACGTIGEGKLLGTRQIVEEINECLTKTQGGKGNV